MGGMASRELKSTSEIVDVLGGISSVARLTGSKYNAACNWKAALTFPSNTYVAMTTALKAKGYRAPASLWGMKEPAEVEQ
jgi:hypothetical protein